MPPGPVSRLLLDALSLVLIDLLLAGDNALVIAMAVRALPKSQRKIAISFGAIAAVALRIGITIVAAQLLNVEFVKMIGGVLVIWIAIRVIADTHKHQQGTEGDASLLKAIWLIVFADITMSVDNVIAIAGAARGSVPLIVFGLGVSIPFVVFSSSLIAALMDRYPVIVYLGAAILGRVGGEMIMTDPFVMTTLHSTWLLTYAVEAAAIIVILVAGHLFSRRSK
jgi:YjbE family integral membrane protein